MINIKASEIARKIEMEMEIQIEITEIIEIEIMEIQKTFPEPFEPCHIYVPFLIQENLNSLQFSSRNSPQPFFLFFK